jgi:hypothetical protein
LVDKYLFEIGRKRGSDVNTAVHISNFTGDLKRELCGAVGYDCFSGVISVLINENRKGKMAPV